VLSGDLVLGVALEHPKKFGLSTGKLPRVVEPQCLLKVDLRLLLERAHKRRVGVVDFIQVEGFLPALHLHLVQKANIPTVSLDVISLVENSYGYYRGQIEQHAAP